MFIEEGGVINQGIGFYFTVTDLSYLTHKPFITFIYRHKSSDFIYKKVLPKQHQNLHDIIHKLKSEGLGYRKISKRLNEMGIKSSTGKEYYPSLVSMTYKGIEKKRKRKVYPTISEYTDFILCLLRVCELDGVKVEVLRG